MLIRGRNPRSTVVTDDAGAPAADAGVNVEAAPLTTAPLGFPP